MQEKKRFEWIDIAKGIGIVLVVLAHSWTDYLNTSMIEIAYKAKLAIYLFHMPLFFFISGFLFKKEKNILGYTMYQFIQLIIPYICIFFLVVALLMLSENIGMITSRAVTKYLWSGRNLYDIPHLYLAPMWFLMCLFNTRIIYNFIIEKSNHWITNIVIILCLLTAYYCNIYIPLLTFPFCLHLVLFTIVFFHFGNIYKKYYQEQINIPILIIGIPAILSPLLFNIKSIDILMAEYGTPFISLICSTIGVLFIINLSKFLVRFQYLNLILSELGKASLIIMALHLVVRPVFSMQFLYENPILNVLFSIIVCYITYRIFSLTRITQIAFIGKGVSKQQIYQLFNLNKNA